MMANQTYTVGETPLIIPFNGFSTTFDCGLAINYEFVQSTGDSLPTFMVPVFNTNGVPGGFLNVSMSPVVNVPQPLYYVYLKATCEQFAPTDYALQTLAISSLLIPINLIVPNYGAVVFSKELKDYKVQVGAITSIILPSL